MKRKVMDEDEQEEAKGDTEGDKQEVAGAEKGKEDEDRDTLDKFMANHTSEDNMEQQATLPYKPGNSFHNPDGLEPTEAEKIEKAKNEKIIIHNNNRISETPRKSDKQVDKLRKEVEQREGLAAGKVGIDGKVVVKLETPSVKNPPDINSKIYQRIKIIEAQHLAAARAKNSFIALRASILRKSNTKKLNI